MLCVAPACLKKTGHRGYALCGGHQDIVKSAMKSHLDQLGAAMVDGRAEVETYLAQEWTLETEWHFSTGDHQIISVKDVAVRLAEFSGLLGFFDRRERKPTLWILPEDEESHVAWREHLKECLSTALDAALASFPSRYAEREIRAAMADSGDYAGSMMHVDVMEGVIGGTLGPVGITLSEEAKTYLWFLYGGEGVFTEVEDPDPAWFRYRVLPDDVMAILDAAREYHAANDAEANQQVGPLTK